MRGRKFIKRGIVLDMLRETDCKTYVEIGIHKGMTMGYILENIDDEDFRAYGVDPYVKYFLKDIKKWRHAKRLKLVKKSMEDRLLQDARYKHYYDFSQYVSGEFEDNSIDMVFIDGNHDYDFFRKDLELYFPKVKKGGIFSGHDYSDEFKNVCRAVDEFSEEKGFPVIYRGERIWMIRK